MPNMRSLLLGVVGIILATGCDRAQESQSQADTDEPPSSSAEQPQGVQDSVPPTEAEEDQERIRITLDGDGNVVEVEGQVGGNWEPKLDQLGEAPVSLGDRKATIEFYLLNDEEADLINSDGSSKHFHAGGTHGSLTSHCHRWIFSNGTYILTHC